MRGSDGNGKSIMKKIKEQVYEFIQKETFRNSENKDGFETRRIAEELGILRSNASAILNELVKEEKLVKTNTRPVLYCLPGNDKQYKDREQFSELIGYNSSLKPAIQLAKAAILYPKKSLNILLCSQSGCGTTQFAKSIYKFAKERQIIGENAPYIKLNCRHYAKNVSDMNDAFFGRKGEIETSCFIRAKGGVLFIDNADLLDAKQQSTLFSFLETGKVNSEEGKMQAECHDVILIAGCSRASEHLFNRLIPVTIELPEIKERPFSERFELINHFFSKEAAHSDRSIKVTAEAVKALLLTEFEYNVKELQFEIKSVCASAYVRVVNEPEQDICVYLEDFKSSIRKSLLYLKKHTTEITALLGDREMIYYDKSKGYQEYGGERERELYSDIKKQYEELNNRGINDDSIENVLNTHIQTLFKSTDIFQKMNENVNLEQLSNIVDAKVIHLVGSFLKEMEQRFGRKFKSSIFFGLCLHVNSLLNVNVNHQRVDNDQIVHVVQNYPEEYAASVQFGLLLKSELKLELSIQELVLITLFLLEPKHEEEGKPVLLYILHGNGTASSLRDVTNALTFCHNAYAYDLRLDLEAKKAIEEIRTLIEQIDQGKGVIVLYDMGSIKTMLDTIQENTDIKIRTINVPITLIGIDVARKCSMEEDIDYVYHMASMEMNELRQNDVKFNRAIITLCHTGEGGAVQLKNYIDQYSKLHIKTIPLAISSKRELLHEVVDIQKTYHIHSFVGTYDPQLLGIPFISIDKIFGTSKENLDKVLMFESTFTNRFGYEQIYSYLEEQFSFVSIPKLKSVLPNVIDEFCIVYNLDEEQSIGLFMHIACLLELLLSGKKVRKNADKERILKTDKESFSTVEMLLKPLEKAFNLIINDDEIATIIMIVKRV